MIATIIGLTLGVIIILIFKNRFFKLFAKKTKASNYEKAQTKLDKWVNDKNRVRTGYTYNHKVKSKKIPRDHGAKASKKKSCTSTPEIRKSNGKFG